MNSLFVPKPQHFLLGFLFLFFFNGLKGQNLVVNPSFETFTGKVLCTNHFFRLGPGYPKLQDSFPGWWQSFSSIHTSCFDNSIPQAVNANFRLACYCDNAFNNKVKGKTAFDGNNALWCQNPYFKYIDVNDSNRINSYFNAARNSYALGTVSSQVKSQTVYFFSVFMSPTYIGSHNARPSDPSEFPFVTADYAFGMMTENAHKNFIKKQELSGSSLAAYKFKCLWVNDSSNIIQTNADSSWTEIKFIFTPDSNYTNFVFGHLPNSLGRGRTAALANHVDYKEPYFSERAEKAWYTHEFYLDAFTLMPYPELGDTVYLCGDSLVLDPNTPNNSLKWFNGSTKTNQTVYEPGKYWVTAFSEFTSITDTVVVIRQKLPQLPTDTVLCTQQSNVIHLNTEANQIKWNTGDTTQAISINKNGIYTVAFNYKNCLIHDTIKVKLDSLKLPNFNDTIICEQEALLIDLEPEAGQFYTWNNGMGINLKVSLNEPLRYTLNVENENCKDSVSFNLEVEPIAKLNYNDTTLCNESSLVIAPKIPFDWKINSGNINEELSVTTAQEIIVSWQQPICGSVSDTISVDFENCNCEAFVPDIFSPNGDGLNDSFQAKFPCGAEQINFRVYNRWGQRVFESNSANESWTGTNIPIDAYYWVLSYKGAYDRKDYYFHGFVQVVK